MTAVASPVTPAVVGWAVTEDGRSLAELSEALGVKVDTLDGWVTGDAAPTRGQVTSLAQVLGRPRALFFLPRPPESATLPSSFRHPPGDDRLVGAAARRKVRQARRLQHAVSWALRDAPDVDVPHALLSTPAEVAAEKARAWLGVEDSEQQSWTSDYAALHAWRQALDDRGVLVFMLEIGRDDVRGFSAWDDKAPLIVANTSGVTPAARCFTLAHELGHLVTRQDAACIDPADGVTPGAEVERWCERFAAAVLMPRAAVQDLAVERSIERRGAGIEDVKAATRRFRVSARAAALRLIDLEYAAPSLYSEVLRIFVPAPRRTDDDRKVVRARRSVARVREYGPRALRTVLTSLPPRDALSMLRVTVDDVRQMAQEVPGVPADL